MFVIVSNSLLHANRAEFWFARDSLGNGTWVPDLARATRYTAEDARKIRPFACSYRVFWIGP